MLRGHSPDDAQKKVAVLLSTYYGEEHNMDSISYQKEIFSRSED